MSKPLGFIPAEMDERQALGNLLESLSIAAAASRQLGFMRGQTDWLRMSQQFRHLREMCRKLGTERPDPEIHDPALYGAERQ